MFDFKREKQAIDQQHAALTQGASTLGVNRRRFLQGLGGLGAVAMLPMPALASRSAPVRKLSLHSINTGEQVTASFWEEGRYLKEGLNTLNRIMRDYRAEEQSEIDPKLYDQLYLLQHRLGKVGEIQIISGYRSPSTNAMLRRTSSGVAKKSYHMKGQAIDLRLPGVPLAQLRQAALNLKVGGVGYYPSSNFVHLDTGPVRSWV
ncbi:YcbK family protein [Oceanisphaera sp. IT1-181]|uniref:YcbK family protein n=1 Tax=Oceanisphaera sp. IT1-181 TaxID=3081199 RepID=UPI0029CA894A|nr:YcbK family protein [Oceanisphaera sp. IT1-181]